MKEGPRTELAELSFLNILTFGLSTTFSRGTWSALLGFQITRRYRRFRRDCTFWLAMFLELLKNWGDSHHCPRAVEYLRMIRYFGGLGQWWSLSERNFAVVGAKRVFQF